MQASTNKVDIIKCYREYIFNNCDNPEDMKDLFINLSPYYKTLGGGTNG